MQRLEPHLLLLRDNVQRNIEGLKWIAKEKETTTELDEVEPRSVNSSKNLWQSNGWCTRSSIVQAGLGATWDGVAENAAHQEKRKVVEDNEHDIQGKKVLQIDMLFQVENWYEETSLKNEWKQKN